MPLILAIEPDRRQAAQLSVVVRKRVQAELILVETTERALDAIGNRMPDLVLVPALLSPQDDAALAAALRVIAAAARVQMLTIPVLGTPRPAVSAGGILSVLRRGKTKAAEPDGCDPAVFAEQIASYLERAAQERPSPITNVTNVADVADRAPREITAAAPRPSYASPSLEYASPSLEYASPSLEYASPSLEYASPSLEYASPSLKAVAAVEHAGVTIEEAVNQEWLETLPAEPAEIVDVVEPAIAAAPDESVSLALEEAVRHLFADLAQPASDPEPEIAPPAEIVPKAPETRSVAGNSRERVAAKSAEKDEWVAVDELIAALQLMPLAAIEVTAEDDWMAPVREEPKRVSESPEQFADDSSPAPVAAKSEREWVALIESLRLDVERLRVERSEKPGHKAAASDAGRPEKTDKTDRPAKPVQDEWGFFDPQQCGFAALLAKLDEVTDSDDGQTNH
jgi:hypothetical protein